VLLAKKNDAGALQQLEIAIGGAKDAPAPIAASAFLEAARVHERLGHKDRALSYYTTAQRWFGGSSETRAAATRALSRLRAQR
jgi:hypothetical protein